jgi:hypothetical protein
MTPGRQLPARGNDRGEPISHHMGRRGPGVKLDLRSRQQITPMNDTDHDEGWYDTGQESLSQFNNYENLWSLN